jgi:hypothetical protein
MAWGRYKSKGGYIRVAFFENNESGKERFTWVPEDSLEFFLFSCPDNTNGWGGKAACVPIQTTGMDHQWILPFKVTAREVATSLRIQSADASVVPTDHQCLAETGVESQESKTGEELLTNIDVVQMLSVDIKPSIITMKIKSSPTAFDLSTDALLSLQKSGVPDEVIVAMMEASP